MRRTAHGQAPRDRLTTRHAPHQPPPPGAQAGPARAPTNTPHQPNPTQSAQQDANPTAQPAHATQTHSWPTQPTAPPRTQTPAPDHPTPRQFPPRPPSIEEATTHAEPPPTPHAR